MNALATLTTKLATKLDMGDGGDLLQALKATAFKGQVTDAQMMSLLAVANQYGLNPWTKEIYAFPDKSNGIVPVVGVDGWARIINSHPQFDGIEFDQTNESCRCSIYRKDRSHPTVVTEYLSECKRGTGPWQSHPRRMLRHKALIQCARLAFGFGGIFDQDEAERIVEKDMGAAQVVTEKPVSRTESVKQKLTAERPEVIDHETGEVQTVGYDDLMARLANCETVDELSELEEVGRAIYRDLEQGQKAMLTKSINSLKEQFGEAA